MRMLFKKNNLRVLYAYVSAFRRYAIAILMKYRQFTGITLYAFVSQRNQCEIIIQRRSTVV